MNPYLVTADAKNTPLRPHLATLVYADPPGNGGWDETHYSLIENYSEFAFRWTTEALRLLSAHSYLIFTVGNKTRYIYEQIMHSYPYIKLVQDLIWYFDFGTYVRSRFVPSHTQLLVYKIGRPKFYWEQIAERSQRMESGDSRADWRGRTPGSVIAVPRVPGNSYDRRYIGKHRSCQPVELLELLVKAYTNNLRADELIIDLFSGSGSMAVVCRKLGRLCVSMDINETFVHQAQQRVHMDWKRFLKEET